MRWTLVCEVIRHRLVEDGPVVYLANVFDVFG